MTKQGRAPVIDSPSDGGEYQRHPEDHVSRYVRKAERSAANVVKAATEGLEVDEPGDGEARKSASKDADGKHTERERAEYFYGGKTDKVTVSKSRRPSRFLARLRRRKEQPGQTTDTHSVETFEDGSVVHTTRRPSVLGGFVEKRTTINQTDDGRRYTGYSVTRYDDEGKVLKQRTKGSIPKIAMQKSRSDDAFDSRQARETSKVKDPEVRQYRRRRAREEAEGRRGRDLQVMRSANAIRERVEDAVTGEAEAIQPKKGVDREGRSVTQVPKKAAKKVDAEAYQARKKAERDAEEPRL